MKYIIYALLILLTILFIYIIISLVKLNKLKKEKEKIFKVLDEYFKERYKIVPIIVKKIKDDSSYKPIVLVELESLTNNQYEKYFKEQRLIVNSQIYLKLNELNNTINTNYKKGIDDEEYIRYNNLLNKTNKCIKEEAIKYNNIVSEVESIINSKFLYKPLANILNIKSDYYNLDVYKEYLKKEK